MSILVAFIVSIIIGAGLAIGAMLAVVLAFLIFGPKFID